MTKIVEKYSRYGVSEWVTLIIGVIIFSIQAVKYVLNGLGDYKLEACIASIWLLLIIAPLTIVNILRKSRGLKTK